MARFLLENITRDKPNVAQYYLGYISDFDEPNLAANPCLNAIVDRFRGEYMRLVTVVALTNICKDPEDFFSREPQLAESYYELLYHLCADPEFCDSTMSYLRDDKDSMLAAPLTLTLPLTRTHLTLSQISLSLNWV